MRALIIGAGIGGLSTALALRKLNIHADVYERAPEPREVGAGISMMANAMRCLDDLGVGDAVRAKGEVWQKPEFLLSDGTILDRVDVAFLKRKVRGDVVLIHRADLLAALLAPFPPDQLHFGHELVNIEQDDAAVHATFANGQRASADILIGADGLHSAVRSILWGNTPPVYSGQTCWRGICHRDPDTLIPRGYLSEIWGTAKRIGIARIDPRRVYWWATHSTPPNGPHPAEPDAKTHLRNLFHDWIAPVPQLIAATDTSHIIRNDLVDRPPLWPWSIGRVTLLGDASHPTTPNLGQGGCMAIEDAIVLARRLHFATITNQPHTTAFERYAQLRYRRTTHVTKLSRLFGKVAQGDTAALRGVRRVSQLLPRSVRLRDFIKLMQYDATRVS